MTSVSTVASEIDANKPAKNNVQVVGRVVPSAMMRNSIGKSRKCVNVGTNSPRTF